METDQKTWKDYVVPVLAITIGIAMFWAMFAFQFFKEYMLAVLSHWVALMSGGVSVLVAIYKEFRKRAGTYVFYVVAVMCVFFAGFQAWQDQYRSGIAKEQALQSEQKKFVALTVPDLSKGHLTVIPVQAHKGPQPRCEVILSGHITNLGAPTVITNWGFVFRFKDGTVLQGEAILPPPPQGHVTIMSHWSKSPMILDGDKWWPLQSGSRPVERGGASVGWIYFLFTVPQEKLMAEKPTAVLSYQDYTGKKWNLEAQFSETPVANPPSLNDL